MKVINLDPYFIPTPHVPTIPFESFTFKGGEPHIKITNRIFLREDLEKEVVITHRIHTFNDLGLLSVAVDALKRLGFKKLILILPYFPGARQDRVMVHGEPLTSAVYVKALDSLGLDEIISVDVHSGAVSYMFEMTNTKFKSMNNHKFVAESITDIISTNPSGNRVLICPDAGAEKKILELSANIQKYPIIYCGKKRDTSNGNLTGFKVGSEDLKGADCIIIDDICDGGGTFLGLAEELKKKNAGDLYLIVTHGIFSNGVKVLTNVFKEVHCTDSFTPLKYTNGVISKKLKVHNIIFSPPNLI